MSLITHSSLIRGDKSMPGGESQTRAKSIRLRLNSRNENLVEGNDFKSSTYCLTLARCETRVQLQRDGESTTGAPTRRMFADVLVIKRETEQYFTVDGGSRNLYVLLSSVVGRGY